MLPKLLPLGLTAGLLALTWPGNAAQAATFVVTHFSDPTPVSCLRSCSLREAVMAANSQPGPHTIVLQAGTYNLTRLGPSNNPQASGPLSIRQSISIVGAGPKKTRIRWDTKGSHQNPVFVLQNSNLTTLNLALNQLSVSHGRGAFGGCLESRTVHSLPNHVQLTDTRFTACQTSGSGGAMQLRATHLTALRSSFDKNLAAANGGAMMLMGTINVMTEDSDWSGNQAGNDGGAVSIDGQGGMVGWSSLIDWVDHGGSRIANNSAGRHGGGIAFRGAGEINLRTAPGQAMADFIAITGNSAERGGGIDLDFGSMAIHAHGHQISRVRLSDNMADSGGGLASNFALAMSDSQIDDNTASNGNGGGILLHGDISWSNGRHLSRLSLFGNIAAGAGGGLFSGCPLIHGSDLSVSGNSAGNGSGQGLQVSGLADLTHLTISNNGSGGPGLASFAGSACGLSALVLRNSVVTDHCAQSAAFIVGSDGGNVLAQTALGCPAHANDLVNVPTAALGLQFSSWNDSFPVLGWLLANPPRPQQGFGLSQYCSASDVRGEQRPPWACDAGAFQAVD